MRSRNRNAPRKPPRKSQPIESPAFACACLGAASVRSGVPTLAGQLGRSGNSTPEGDSDARAVQASEGQLGRAKCSTTRGVLEHNRTAKGSTVRHARRLDAEVLQGVCNAFASARKTECAPAAGLRHAPLGKCAPQRRNLGALSDPSQMTPLLPIAPVSGSEFRPHLV